MSVKPFLAKLVLAGLVLFCTALAVSAQLAMPLYEMRLNCRFGQRIHPVTRELDYHKGIDLFARTEPVFSIMEGKVMETGYNPILGNYVRICHLGLESIYGHLSTILVERGRGVACGELIGVSGRSGRVTGEHLHFSVKVDGVYVDPVLFFLRFLDLSKQMKHMEKDPVFSLLQKLSLLAIVEEVELDADEARAYGVDFADREEVRDG